MVWYVLKYRVTFTFAGTAVKVILIFWTNFGGRLSPLEVMFCRPPHQSALLGSIPAASRTCRGPCLVVLAAGEGWSWQVSPASCLDPVLRVLPHPATWHTTIRLRAARCIPGLQVPLDRTVFHSELLWKPWRVSRMQYQCLTLFQYSFGDSRQAGLFLLSFCIS